MVYSAPLVLAQFVKLQTIRFVLTSVLLAFGVGAAAAQTSEATGAPTEIKKVSRPMAYGLALTDVGVRVEMHLYARGGHAFGMRPTSDPITTEWPKLVEKWLQTVKVF